MRIITPEYYDRFSCLADKCTDNCCIGWEIDVDECTMDKYRAISGNLADRLARCISVDEPHSFILEGERCPFLNRSNLCDIISELGEGYLCDICREHPRYYNVFGDYAEGGIALACEAAADIVLNAALPIEYTDHSTEDDAPDTYADLDALERCLRLRDDLYDLIFREDISGSDTLNSLLLISSCIDIKSPAHTADGTAAYGTSTSISSEESTHKRLRNILLTAICKMMQMEALNDTWYARLSHAHSLINREFDRLILCIAQSSDCLRRLLFYFLHRHFINGLYEDDYSGRLRLAIVSATVIFAMSYKDGAVSKENLALAAKEYSKNIEYSTENTEELILLLQGYI